MKIAFQGELGAYSHEAIVEGLGTEPEVAPSDSFQDVFRLTTDGTTDVGLVPIENALTGSIHEVYDLLLAHDLSIVMEVTLPIRHELLGVPGSSLDDIEAVYSHPQGLWQCSRFLDDLNVERVAVYDTAGAARWVAEGNDAAHAAIAGPLAADLYGLDTLARDISTQPHNATRFVVLGEPSAALAKNAPYKTSLVVELAHEPGALYDALLPFSRNGINLTKLESRPMGDAPWQYRFYLDFEGHVTTPSVQTALDELGARVASYRVLGTYPSVQGGDGA
ncbi:MAG: prephenate dehydratase [Candidatus Bipolaricaulia bacterium]